jgi:hypothetical protein
MAARKKTWGGRREGAGRKPRLSDGVSVTGELERADVEALREIAQERGVSLATVLRAAVRAYVKRHGRK